MQRIEQSDKGKPLGDVIIPTTAEELARNIPRTGLCPKHGRCSKDCPHKTGPGYFLAEVRPGGRRRRAETLGSAWLVLDIDQGDPAPELSEYERVEVQSHSGNWHVLVRLERMATPDEYDATIAPWVAKGADDGAKDVCRFLYAPGPGALVDWFPGKRMPVAKAEVREQVEFAPPAARTMPSERFRDSWTARFVRDARASNALAGALGATLARWGWGDPDIDALMRHWLGAADPKLDKHVNDALRGAATARLGERMTGIPKLQELGVVVDEAAPDYSGVATQAEARAAMGGRLYTAAALALVELPPVDWVSARWAIAPGPATTCTGFAGSGKTTFAQALAVAVASGGEFLGEPLKRGGVLHIDHEQGHRETAERYQQGGLQAEDDLEYLCMPTWRLGSKDASRVLGHAVAGKRLCIIDNLRASTPGRDENDSSIRDVLDQISPLSEATGCAFLVLHHEGKPNKGDERSDLQTGRGSSAIADAVATSIRIQRGKEGVTATLSKLRTTSGRGPDAYKFGQAVPLELNKGHLGLAGQRADLELRAAALPDGMTQRQVAEKLGVRREVAIEVYKRSRKSDPEGEGR